jgi:hypothetical protein
MQKMLCDRCRKVIEESEDHGTLSVDYTPADTSKAGKAWHGVDICAGCDTAVGNLIDRLLLSKSDEPKRRVKPILVQDPPAVSKA